MGLSRPAPVSNTLRRSREQCNNNEVSVSYEIDNPIGYNNAHKEDLKKAFDNGAKFFKASLTELEDIGYTPEQIKAFAFKATQEYQNALLGIVNAKYPISF